MLRVVKRGERANDLRDLFCFYAVVVVWLQASLV
jgi:hypothetical protein